MGYGANIERGRITAKEGEGYKVASLDRDGIESPALPIMPVPTGIEAPEYTVGDTVYFFLFRDGTGRIICKV